MNSKPKPPPSPKEPIPLPDDDTGPSKEEVIYEAILDDFFRALAAGDDAAAAKAVRKLDVLPRSVSELLADLFEGDPVLADLYPFRLKLVPRKRGRPPIDRLTKEGEEQAIARAVLHALPMFVKVDAAAHYVQHQFAKRGKKMSRSAILKCFKAHRDKFLNKQSP